LIRTSFETQHLRRDGVLIDVEICGTVSNWAARSFCIVHSKRTFRNGYSIVMIWEKLSRHQLEDLVAARTEELATSDASSRRLPIWQKSITFLANMSHEIGYTDECHHRT
jgi:hypothetical protein